MKGRNHIFMDLIMYSLCIETVILVTPRSLKNKGSYVSEFRTLFRTFELPRCFLNLLLARDHQKFRLNRYENGTLISVLDVHLHLNLGIGNMRLEIHFHDSSKQWRNSSHPMKFIRTNCTSNVPFFLHSYFV